MSFWSSRPRLRWSVPCLATALVLGGTATAGAFAAADPELPPRGAEQLLVDLQTAEVDGFSGTVVQRAELGLPELPSPDGDGNADLTSLLSGSNTLRVWYGGPEQIRVALLGTLGQSDVIRDGSDLWTWDSTRNEASHQVLPELTGSGAPIGPGAMTPQEAAEHALAAMDPTTEVTAEGTTEVAGRAAYELVFTPEQEGTLIRQVRLAIDAEHHLPLRVQVYGSAADPAFDVRFDQISFGKPDPEQFRFNPPPGATVTEMAALSSLDITGMAGWPRFAVLGEGWATVVAARIPAESELDLAGVRELLPPVSGDWGSGRMLAGTLFSVLLTDDGRVLVGPVTPERLTEAAADPAAALES